MNFRDYLEVTEDIDAYKELFDSVLDTYGKDIEVYIIRMMTSMAHVQRVYYTELIAEGFTPVQAFTLLLEARNAIKNIDLASRSTK